MRYILFQRGNYLLIGDGFCNTSRLEWILHTNIALVLAKSMKGANQLRDKLVTLIFYYYIDTLRKFFKKRITMRPMVSSFD